MKIVFSQVPAGRVWKEEILFSLCWAMTTYFSLPIEYETQFLGGGYGIVEVHVKVVGAPRDTDPALIKNVASKIFNFLKLHDLHVCADVYFPGVVGGKTFFIEEDFPELTQKISPSE